MQHVIWCDSAVGSHGSSTLRCSVLPWGHRGQDPSDLTPHRHEHMGFISEREPVWLHADKKVLAFVSDKKKSCYSLPVSFLLLYLHFMCLPAAHTSSGVLWGTGGVFSSLTNMVEIACRLTMGVHLDLGHTLFVVVPLPPLSFFPLLAGALLQQFSQMKEQLPDLLSYWLPWSRSSGQNVTRRPSPAGCRPCHRCGQQLLPHLLSVPYYWGFSYHQEAFL